MTMALEFVNNFNWHDSDLEDIPPTLSPIPSPIQLPIRGRHRPSSDEPEPSAQDIQRLSEDLETYDLRPSPTNKRFKTSDRGLLHINGLAEEHGYGVTTKTSKKHKHGTTKVAVYLQCDWSRPILVRPKEQLRI
jgi:hypothetical protein